MSKQNQFQLMISIVIMSAFCLIGSCGAAPTTPSKTTPPEGAKSLDPNADKRSSSMQISDSNENKAAVPAKSSSSVPQIPDKDAGGVTISTKGTLNQDKPKEPEKSEQKKSEQKLPSSVAPGKELNVLFLTEVAKSMEEKDPLVNGSCRRFDAIKGFIDSVKSKTASDVSIKGAFIPFTDSVSPSSVMGLSNIDSISAALTAADACKAQGDASLAAPLLTAQNLLKGNKNPAIVYLLSGGVPNVAGDGSIRNDNDPVAVSDALAAADSLKKSNPSLVLNVLMLESDNKNGASAAKPAMNAVATSQDNVVQVSNAANLLNAVMKFGSSLVCLISILC
ncbi:MAG: hypothetical protein HQK54_14385 [Oligoflexales bacterium]|nr:hypothetical protein [Oligoflexales bacterium]